MTTRRTSQVIGLGAALLALLGLLALGLWWALRDAGPGEPVAPPRGATATAPDAPVSSIVLPIVVPAEALEAAIRSGVPQTFVEDKGRKLDGGFVLDTKIERSGPASLEIRKGALETTVPVETRIDVTPPRVKKPITVDCALEVTARTTLSLGDDWRLRSKTTLRYTWTRPPVLRVGPVEIPVRKLVESRLDDQLTLAAERVDADLREQDPVRPKVEDAWASLHQPIPLGGDTPGWLKIAPQALVAADPVFRGDGLHLEVGLRGQFTLLVGEEPAAGTPGPLPDREAPDGEPAFALQIPVSLSWDALDLAMRPQVVGRAESLDVPGSDTPVTFTVEGLALYPSGDRIVAAIDYALEGPSTPLDGRGRLYLSGVPTLDARAQSLSLTGLAAAVETDSAAVEAAAWLVRAGGLERLEERLRAPLAGPLADARARIEGGLAAPKGQPATVSADIADLRLAAVVPTADALVVLVTATGTATVALDALPPLARPKRGPRQLEIPKKKGRGK